MTFVISVNGLNYRINEEYMGIEKIYTVGVYNIGDTSAYLIYASLYIKYVLYFINMYMINTHKLNINTIITISGNDETKHINQEIKAFRLTELWQFNLENITSFIEYGDSEIYSTSENIEFKFLNNYIDNKFTLN